MSDWKVQRVTRKRKRRWVVHVWQLTGYKLFDMPVSYRAYLNRAGVTVPRPVYFTKRAQVERALGRAALLGWPEEQSNGD